MSDQTLSPGGPDSDLLFAALAHQLGFVRREDLLESLGLWAGWASSTARPVGARRNEPS